MPAQLICCSHSPLMNTSIEATDANAQQRFYRGVAGAAEELAAFKPDLITIFYPDHFIGFFFDTMPSFCIGLAAESATEFGVKTQKLRVAKDTGLECVRHLHKNGFDVAVSHKMVADHGLTIPLIQLTGGLDKCEVLPIFVNCAADPRPSFQRVRLFGAEVGRYFAGTGKRVAVVGSGGLSHDSPSGMIAKRTPERFLRENRRTPEQQIAFEEMGLENARAMMKGDAQASRQPNAEWDRRFLDSLVNFREAELDRITDEELDGEVGGGTHEVRSWVAAAACAHAIDRIEASVKFYHVIPEWITGMAVVTSKAA